MLASLSFCFTCSHTPRSRSWLNLSFGSPEKRWPGNSSMTLPPACFVFSIASKTVNLLNVYAWHPAAKPDVLYSSGMGTWAAAGTAATSRKIVALRESIFDPSVAFRRFDAIYEDRAGRAARRRHAVLYASALRSARRTDAAPLVWLVDFAAERSTIAPWDLRPLAATLLKSHRP